MNKYRIGSKRLQGYDYTSPGKYFITICIKNKIPYFGKIENGEMILSELGIVARDLWIAIPDHCQNIELDEFVIMPDHIHGIISIKTNSDSNIVETTHASFLQTNIQNPIPISHGNPVIMTELFVTIHNYPASENISGIIHKIGLKNTGRDLMNDEMYCLSRSLPCVVELP